MHKLDQLLQCFSPQALILKLPINGIIPKKEGTWFKTMKQRKADQNLILQNIKGKNTIRVFSYNLTDRIFSRKICFLFREQFYLHGIGWNESHKYCHYLPQLQYSLEIQIPQQNHKRYRYEQNDQSDISFIHPPVRIILRITGGNHVFEYDRKDDTKSNPIDDQESTTVCNYP